mmetsp:Transcript_31552/g.122201  ORF Transcript_31552/g.122201 Transcript_31552/m.122201 type:complete len:104 (-) Transcript_31552:263-574(-)
MVSMFPLYVAMTWQISTRNALEAVPTGLIIVITNTCEHIPIGVSDEVRCSDICVDGSHLAGLGNDPVLDHIKFDEQLHGMSAEQKLLHNIRLPLPLLITQLNN